MKYRLQPTPLAVPVQGRFDDEDFGSGLLESFGRLYRDRFGPYAPFSDATVEIVKARVDARGGAVLPALIAAPVDGSPDPESALKGNRATYFTEVGSYVDTKVYDGDRLKPGMKLQGPAIVERMGDSIVMPTFASASVDGFGNVVLSLDVHQEGRS
jgi:N-methylhydantoinase A